MFNWLGKTMEQPAPFGTFHLCFFIGFLILAICLVVFCKKCSDKVFRKIVFVCWLIICIFEVFKQILWNYDFTNNTFSGYYNWSSFPYQLCSLPFYVWPITIFGKDSKFRDVVNMFISTFLFFAGFAYFFFPVSFCGYVFINIQTLVHHGMQAVVGLYVFAHESNKFNFKIFFKSFIVLVVSIIVAILLNVLVTVVFNSYTNLFELNPINLTQAVVFGDIVNAVGYIPFVFIYIFGFTAFAIVIYILFKYIPKIFVRK